MSTSDEVVNHSETEWQSCGEEDFFVGNSCLVDGR